MSGRLCEYEATIPATTPTNSRIANSTSTASVLTMRPMIRPAPPPRLAGRRRRADHRAHRQDARGAGAVRDPAVRRRGGGDRRLVLAQPARHQPDGGLPALAFDARAGAQRGAAGEPLPR